VDADKIQRRRDKSEGAATPDSHVHRPHPSKGMYLPLDTTSLTLLSLFFKGLSIYRPIIYGNTAIVLTPEEREAHPSREHTHRWTVAVRSAATAEDSDIVGGADDLGYFIRRVTFKLHETYPNPSRSEYRITPSSLQPTLTCRTDIDRPPFEVTETGCALSHVLFILFSQLSCR
jgi:YEATS family